MNRFSRQLIDPSRISRVLRPQRPLGSRHTLPLSVALCCRHASSGLPRRANGKFDRLFASLRPGLKEDELAMMIAALVLSTRNPKNLEKLESSIPKYMKNLNSENLYKKVNHYIANPPEDDFDSIIAPAANATDSSALDVSSPVLSGDAPTVEVRKSSVEIVGTPQSPLDELMARMQTPEARRTLESLEPEEQAEFRYLMSNVLSESGNEDMEVLNRIAQLLSHHGLDIQYSSRSQVAGEPQPRNLLAIGYQDDESPRSEIESAQHSQGPDPVEMAKRAAADESLNPLTEPAEVENDPYPDLMTPDPLMDSRDVTEFPPDKDSPYHNRVTVRNNASIFHEALDEDGFDFSSEDWSPITTDQTEEQLNSQANLPLTPHELRQLYRFPLIKRRITQQTGKGKIQRLFVLMVVGNGNGLVGYGQGKDEDPPRAEAKAYAQAVRNMDWVERFEKRTIWTEMESKLGATHLILRPRPVGFGLRCNPHLHQVLKAAGIKDISAKVWGSRNPINVIKTAFRMLQAGHAPLAMGDGIGGPGRKLNKGSGLRSKSDVERERGRKLISLRK